MATTMERSRLLKCPLLSVGYETHLGLNKWTFWCLSPLNSHERPFVNGLMAVRRNGCFLFIVKSRAKSHYKCLYRFSVYSHSHTLICLFLYVLNVCNNSNALQEWYTVKLKRCIIHKEICPRVWKPLYLYCSFFLSFGYFLQYWLTVTYYY